MKKIINKKQPITPQKIVGNIGKIPSSNTYPAYPIPLEPVIYVANMVIARIPLPNILLDIAYSAISFIFLLAQRPITNVVIRNINTIT
jgi:hypothetical protein